MKLYLSKLENNKKPATSRIKQISATILEDLVDIDIQTFAEELTEKGRTAVLAVFAENKLSRNTEILSQEVVMLDFDNTKKEVYTLDDLENDLFMQDHASFFYRTFSDKTSNIDKFRVAFKLNRKVTSNLEIFKIYQKLFEMYPQADTTVGQTNRLFFGSTESYVPIDFDNVLLVDELLSETNPIDSTSKIIAGDDINVNTPVYKLLKYKAYDLVREKLGDKYVQGFPDFISANQFFKTQNMQELLELPEGNPFLDILHVEENPSASVYLDKDINIYLYKCFSETAKFTGDILMLLKKYLNLSSYSEATDILLYCTNGFVNSSSPLGRLKRDTQEFSNQLIFKELEKTSPELYSYYKHYAHEISAVISILFDFTYFDKVTGEVRYLNYFSVDKLAQHVGTKLNKHMTRQRMWTILNLIVVTEMITKLDHSQIPKELLESLIGKQLDTEQIRTSNVYEPTFSVENSQEIARIMRENKVVVSSLGYELIYRLFGEEKAKKDFPQAYKPLIEKGLIDMATLDKNLTKKQMDFEKMVVKILQKELESKGYCFENVLVEKLKKKAKKSLSATRESYIKIRPELIQKYDLELRRTTKKDFDEKGLGLKGKVTYKNIILKK